jgi:hypothetical protein
MLHVLLNGRIVFMGLMGNLNKENKFEEMLAS